MGLLDSIEELLSGQLERRLERERAMRGARLLDPASRALVERVLSGAGTRRRTATPTTTAPATRHEDTGAASFEAPTGQAAQQTASRPRAPRVLQDESDPEVRTRRIVEETKPLRAPTRDERFASAESDFASSATPTTDQLVSSLRARGLGVSDTPAARDVRGSVGERLRAVALPEVPDVLGDARRASRERSGATAARIESISGSS